MSAAPVVVPPAPARGWPSRAWDPRPHPQLLRGPRHRWWRPLLSLAVAAGGVAVLLVLSLAATLAAGAAAGVDDPFSDAATTTWWGFLVGNLTLAALVPVAWLAVWAGHRLRPRWVSSVVGGVRWRWLLLSAAVPLVVLLATTAGYALLSGDPEPFGSGDRGSTGAVVALLVVVALTTPLQCAGEEVFFRGWLSQAVGSWSSRAAVGAVVAAVVSSLLFGLAHGSQDPWLFADRVGFGLTASWLAWRTGGLEAGIAFHAVNNVLVFVPVVLAGGLADSLAVTTAPPSLVLLDGAGFVAVAVGVEVLARRRRLRRLSAPPV